MNAALVTGHQGFIGRHFYSRLIELDFDVTGVDIADPVTPMDCRDYFKETPGEQFDLVVHCAAVVGGRAKIDGEPLAVADNLGIDSAMFQWATKARPKRIVYFSSSAAYPVSLQQPGSRHNLRESDMDIASWQPDATYGWCKLSGEYLAREAARSGLAVYVFRPFSGYGSDQSLDYPFPSFILRACRREDPFQVWGTGEQVRDWIHVEDIVEAVLEALRADVRGPVNLGTGIGTSMNQLIRLICERVGYNPRIMPVGGPEGVARRVAEIGEMYRFYSPQVDLRGGIDWALDDVELKGALLNAVA